MELSGTSPVTHLTIRKVGNVSGLNDMLTWPAALEELHYHIEGDFIGQTIQHEALGVSLQPTMYTLKHLSIQHSPTFIGNDAAIQPLIDLSSFTALKSVCLAHCTLFGLRNSPTGSIYHLLPPQLERLQIEFTRWSPVVYNDPPDSFYDYPLSQERQKNLQVVLGKSKWLLELALQKGKHLQNLKYVKLQEGCQQPEWTPPEALRESFEKANIKLNVTLRESQLPREERLRSSTKRRHDEVSEV
jgi:hypothetical protein